MGELTATGFVSRLTDVMRHQPRRLLLLDEIHKAHPDVLGAVRLVLERGRLADGMNGTVGFRHALVVMTSTTGSATGAADAVPPAIRALGLDSFAETVTFRRLTAEQQRQVAQMMQRRTA
jgi:ATP-dependent Clp protease ATP-binding subunit ClpA